MERTTVNTTARLSCLVVALCLACAAQQQQPPDAPQPQAQSQQSPTHGSHFNFLNSFLAADASSHRLDAKDKFMLANHFLGPFTLLTAAGSAGISQASDSHQAWGQGAEGYGKRFGAAFADATSYNYLGVAVFPSLFHQDPRYFSKGSGGFFSRVAYAGSRTLVTRGDSGRTQFNISNVMGAFASGGIGTAYYPDNEREAGDAAVRGALTLAYNAAWNALMEFTPEVKRKIFHKN